MEAWLGFAGFVLEAGAIVVAVVWFVSKMQGQAKVLDQTVRNLATSVRDLSSAVNRLDDKLDSHSERLARLEAYNEKG